MKIMNTFYINTTVHSTLYTLFRVVLAVGLTCSHSEHRS